MIGLFDSGVGGLSIYKEVKALLPRERAVFVADQSFVPYGEKTKGELVDRVSRIIDFLIGRAVKLVVMACNTATVFTLEEARERFGVPIIGVVPAVKPAAAQTRANKIAVMCTARTAVSAYLRELISKFASQCNVIKIGCPGLVECIEDGEVSGNRVEALISSYLKGAKERGVDCVVLGSTHYPFVRGTVERFMGPGVAVIDSGAAVAAQTARIVQGKNRAVGADIAVGAPSGQDEFFTTGEATKFSRVASILLDQSIIGSHITL